MGETARVQGQEITKGDIELVRRLIEANPLWNRTWLSKTLCLLWDWRAANGQLKDMACRALLSKLKQRGYVSLPIEHKDTQRLRNRIIRHNQELFISLDDPSSRQIIGLSGS